MRVRPAASAVRSETLLCAAATLGPGADELSRGDGILEPLDTGGDPGSRSLARIPHTVVVGADPVVQVELPLAPGAQAADPDPDPVALDDLEAESVVLPVREAAVESF